MTMKVMFAGRSALNNCGTPPWWRQKFIVASCKIEYSQKLGYFYGKVGDNQFQGPFCILIYRPSFFCLEF